MLILLVPKIYLHPVEFFTWIEYNYSEVKQSILKLSNQ